MAQSRFFANSELAERIHLARGMMKGASSIHKFGAVPAMSTGVTGSVWDKSDTPYPWSAFNTPGILTVQLTTANGSAATNDDGMTITIIGLDANFLPQEDSITVSGGVGTGTKTFARVYRAYLSDGVTNANQWRVSRGGTEVLRISIGQAQTLMAVYTVPAGKTGYLLKGTASCQANADASVSMYARYSATGQFRIGHTLEVSGAGGQYTYDFTIPIELPPKTDIDVRATVRSNNARVTAAFDIILLDY